LISDHQELEANRWTFELKPFLPVVSRSCGMYERMSQTAARLCGEWLPSSGHEPRSAPMVALHRNWPVDTPPEDLLTDVYLSLQ
jgi:AraC family transcriptional regulator